jgi:ABC-type cobalamin/Fe3+-siderophores transport system ATPase subunit
MTQKEALDILKMGYNCYITGAAGSGKTHLLNEYINFLKSKGVEVGITASTGIAATHMGGTTIHSWSGIGIRDELTEYDLEDLESKKYIYDRFKETKVLIIDEISMLHHFRLDLVERIARHLKRNDLPFGGMQVVLCGDFFQLPPVFRYGEKEALFSYHSMSWKKLNLKICYLEEQHRQKDQAFLKVLNDIRGGRMSSESMKHLKDRYNKEPETKVEPTKLHTHNIDVDKINDTELGKLSGQIFAFNMDTKGKKPLVEALKKSCLAPETLRLKIGSRVMFVKNNFESGYANGSLGKVISCDYSGPKVMLVNGKVINVEKATWMVEEEGKVKAQIIQYPLRLAWAITVHKSQGMSLDAIEVDLSRSFERGMGYVALSRVRSLAGLKIIGLNDNALEVREDIIEFDKDLMDDSEKDQRWLMVQERGDIEKKQKEFLASIAPADGVTKANKKRRVSASDKTRLALEEGFTISEIAKTRGITSETVISNIEKLVEKDPDFNIIKLKESIPPAKFKKIYIAFKNSYGENRDFLLAPIKNKLGAGFTYEELRIVRLFVKKSL